MQRLSLGAVGAWGRLVKRWTLIQAVVAIRDEAERLGRTPKADDLRLSDGRCPSPQTCIRLAGTLNNLQRIAGLVPTLARGDGRRKRAA